MTKLLGFFICCCCFFAGCCEAWNAFDWMTRLPSNVVAAIPMVKLVLPGAHDSMSYNLSESIAPGIAVRYAKSQEWNVSMQLAGGIRYFDLRVYMDDDGEFRFYHGYVKGGLEVLPTLTLVRQFLTKHPGEVIILHFQAFDNIKLDQHRVLINAVLQIFGNLAAARCHYNSNVTGITLGSLRSAGHQVFLVSYDSLTQKVDPCTFWNSSALINPYFPTTSKEHMNATLTSELHNRTLANTTWPANQFFVYQAVLTPDANYILRHLGGSLKELALPGTQLVATEWMPNIASRHCSNAGAINIVMCDFVDTFNFTGQVIEANWKFSKCLVKNDDEIIV